MHKPNPGTALVPCNQTTFSYTGLEQIHAFPSESIRLFIKGMALLAGHKRFEDFTIVYGIVDGFPGAAVWAFIFVVSYLRITHFLGIFRTLLHETPRAQSTRGRVQ